MLVCIDNIVQIGVSIFSVFVATHYDDHSFSLKIVVYAAVRVGSL